MSEQTDGKPIGYINRKIMTIGTETHGPKATLAIRFLEDLQRRK